MKRSLVKSVLSTLAVLILMGSSCVYAGTTYDKVKKTGVVKVGMQYNSIPAAYYNDKNEWVGFDVDMAEEVVKRLGDTMGKEMKMERVKVNNKTRISFLTSGRVDISVSNMTHKRERDKTIDFSLTYFFDGQKVMAKKGKFKSHKDLVGKRICAMQGTTSEKNILDLLKSLGVTNPQKYLVSYQDAAACFTALMQGKVAAWSTDSTILLGYAAKMPGKFEFVGDFLSDEPYGMGLPENDSDWRDAVNFAIQDIWKDGTYMKIYNKWYGPDTPYYFPMTSEVEMWP